MPDLQPADGAQIAEAETGYSPDVPLRLLYGGSIVVQLGSQLYPSVTAAVAELISNAWDADARRVWVSLPFGDEWHDEGSTIEVLDDGIGMTREEAQFKYLVVGRERRKAEGTDQSVGGRPLHGRKGIGKLAAFGTGRMLEVITQREGEPALGFRMDYEDLRALEPAQSALVEEFDPEPLRTPDNAELSHGTRVRLSKLQAKRQPSRDRFELSMRRRFALDESQMQITINANSLRRFDLDFQYRFPDDRVPPGASVSDDGLAVELVDDGTGEKREVRWWIGFLAEPVKDELLQGVSVLVRGKQAQRPFKFERTGGTENQLGYEYLVGEVHADWIDDGIDDDSDLIASNRDTLQLEDPRLQPFIAWGRQRLRWAMGERGRLQAAVRVRQWSEDFPRLRPVLGRVSKREQQALGRVAERLARVEGLEESDVADVMQRVLDVREEHTATEIAQEIHAFGDARTGQTWQLADDAAVLERRGVAAFLRSRLALLAQVAEVISKDTPPPALPTVIARNPWLIDLRFDRSRTRPMNMPSDAGEAVVWVGPPAWDLGARPTVIAACWSTGSSKQWVDALRGSAEINDERLFLVAPHFGEKVDAEVSTWEECIERSLEQHEAWLALVKSKGGSAE